MRKIDLYGVLITSLYFFIVISHHLTPPNIKVDFYEDLRYLVAQINGKIGTIILISTVYVWTYKKSFIKILFSFIICVNGFLIMQDTSMYDTYSSEELFLASSALVFLWILVLRFINKVVFDNNIKEAKQQVILETIGSVNDTIEEIKQKRLTGELTNEEFKEIVSDQLQTLSKCKPFID